MIFEKEYTIGNRDIRSDNKATNKAIFKCMENIACCHSDYIGYGINQIKFTEVVWILLDWKFKVIERPIYGQTIIAKTWSRKIEKCCAYRDFEIYDKNKKLIAIATSKWVLLNATTRKIQRISKEIIDKHEPEIEKHVFEYELEKMCEEKNEETSINLKIRKTDIDINNHVNNLNYLDLAYEVLPVEIYNEDIRNVRITYKHQIEPEKTVNIAYTRKEEKNIITIKSEDKTKLHAIVELW